MPFWEMTNSFSRLDFPFSCDKISDLTNLFFFCFFFFLLLVGHFGAQALEATAKSASEASDASSAGAAVEAAVETAKDKRQVSSKETSLYPNHRSDAAAAVEQADDPEDGQETIYGPKPNQFIIRPIAPHQHQQHESHQEPQLRNYAAAASRPHAAQLLEQSQEVSQWVGGVVEGGGTKKAAAFRQEILTACGHRSVITITRFFSQCRM